MASEEKKTISFGFSRQLKKPNIFNAIKQNSSKQDIQLIDCVESKSIKVVGGEESKEKVPLVIPLTKSKNASKINDTNKKEIQSEQAGNGEKKELTLDEIAAQELINESKNISAKPQSKLITISTLTDNGVITGEPEPTLDDYENIPISEFGKAMLRGMGWKEEEEDKKKDKNVQNVLAPRPKGMGLGADKLATQQTQTALNENGEELKLVKGAYVKITSGRDKNKFGQVQGFDDDSGAVILKMALDGSIKSYQEFLVTPVTKEEYGKNAKVLNLQKYEDYSKKDQSEAKDERKFSRKDSSRENYHSERRREYESKSSRHRKDDEYKSERGRNDRRDRSRYDSDSEYKSERRERSSRKTDRHTPNSSDTSEDRYTSSRNRREKSKKQSKQEYDDDSDYESRSRKVKQEESSDDDNYKSKSSQKSSKSSSKHKHKRDSHDDRQKRKSKKKHRSRSRSRSKQRKK